MKIGGNLILTILLGNLFGCQVNSQVKSNVNQSFNNQNAAASSSKNSPLKLTLNKEKAGTTGDSSVLSERLEKIFKDREKNGIVRKDSDEIESSVYLSADRSALAEEIAGLFGVLKKSKAYPVLIPVSIKEEDDIFPNPLALVVHAGSGEPRPAYAGMEIGFIGELSENSGKVPTDKNEFLIAASKNGTYSMDGKQISARDLKTAIENRFKTKEKSKKILVVQADNYGNMEDAAAIAESAGADKLYFMTKNIRQTENDVSFSLSPAFYKADDQTEDPPSILFYGPDHSSFEITLHDELIDKERTETEINSVYESRKEMFKPSEMSKTEIDGSSGVLTIRNDGEGFTANWFGFRKKNGKQQPVLIMFSCGRAEAGFCNAEFLQIIRSIKFN